MQYYHPGVPGNVFLRKMAEERRILAINALLLPLAALASTFQCCGFLLSILMLQRLRQRQCIAQAMNSANKFATLVSASCHIV